jgi:hypothetical protein
MGGSTEAGFHCCLWLLLLAEIMSVSRPPSGKVNGHLSKFFSKNDLDKLSSIIYPDMLADPCVMPAAIAMAMGLKEPQKLLFESIGFLQDTTFDYELSKTEAIVHYENLIAIVVLEGAKVRVRARVEVMVRVNPNPNICLKDSLLTNLSVWG